MSAPKRSNKPPVSPLPSLATSLLVIVPCGRSKIWSKDPDGGPTPAAHAYTGAPFTVNREYAEASGGDWVILSAKYGFLRPAEVITGPYEVTFKSPRTHPIGLDALRDQVRRMSLDRYSVVIGLGGKEYRAAIEAAFTGAPTALSFPFAGLPIGKAMAAAKRAIGHGRIGVDENESPLVDPGGGPKEYRP